VSDLVSSDGDICRLMEGIGADPNNSHARLWLENSLRAIPYLVAAKGAAPTQGERNSRLEAVGSAARRLKAALGTLDVAGAVDIEEAAIAAGKLFDRWELERTVDDLEAWAEVAKQPAPKGNDRNEGKLEAAKILVGFAVRFGTCAPSEKADGPFETFAREAYRIVTGDGTGLVRAIAEVRRSGYVDEVSRPRAHHLRSVTE
jgi:hypothetical protein